MKFLKFTKKLTTLKKRGMLLILATLFGNFFNFLYNAYLGRAISIEDFALISLIGSFLGIADVPLNALGRSVTHKSAFLLGKYKAPAQKFWHNTRKKAFLVSCVITFLWIAASPFLKNYFHLDSILPLLAIAPIWIFGIMSSVDGGYIKGNLLFGYLAIVSIIEALLRFVVVYVFASYGLGKFVYISLPISSLSTFLLVSFFAKRGIKEISKTKKQIDANFPFKFFTSTAVTKISATIYLTFDVILAKHYLPAKEAGLYALLSLTGKMVYFAGSLFSQFILPLVSHKEGEGVNSQKTFLKLLFGTFASSFIAFAVVGLLGKFTMPLLFGDKIVPIIPLAAGYTGAMVAFTIATNIVAYHQIKNQHLLPFINLIIAILQIILISLYHKDVNAIANVMIFLGFLSLLVIGILHIFYGKFIIFLNNINDLIDLFKPFKVRGNGTRILIFNWRDTKHIWAGGAEVYVSNLAYEWRKKGHQVTIFCGNDGRSKRDDSVKGVRIIRRGGFYTVYLWAVLYYLFKFRRQFDIIIDSENGVPFFSPLFSRKPVILLIHHVHQEIFVNHLNFPMSYIARFIEAKAMPFVYKSCNVITVSKSSKNEIVKIGISSESKIHIINPGVRLQKIKQSKSKNPTFIYLGRLKKYKNIDIAIKAFKKINLLYSNSEFFIAGEGDFMDELKLLTKKLKLEKSVLFLGKVSERKKSILLAKSWVLVQPSQMEGWGITVIEANAHGTPVIASNVNGLKDSILNKKTGLLVKVNDVNDLYKAMLNVVGNKNMRKELSKNSLRWAYEFSWVKNANDFYNIISTVIEKSTVRKLLPNISLSLFNRN